MILTMESLEDEYQQKKSFKLQISRTPAVFNYTDCFGNKKHYFNILEAVQELSILSSSTLYVSERESPLSLSHGTSWKALDRLREKGIYWHWFSTWFFYTPFSYINFFY